SPQFRIEKMIRLLGDIHRRIGFLAPAVRLIGVVNEIVAGGFHEFGEPGSSGIYRKSIDEDMTLFTPCGRRQWNAQNQQNYYQQTHGRGNSSRISGGV